MTMPMADSTFLKLWNETKYELKNNFYYKDDVLKYCVKLKIKKSNEYQYMNVVSKSTFKYLLIKIYDKLRSLGQSNNQQK